MTQLRRDVESIASSSQSPRPEDGLQFRRFPSSIDGRVVAPYARISRARASPEGFTVATFQGKEGLARIEGDWKRVVQGLECPRFFHLYEWYWSYLDALVADDSVVFFFVAYREGAPVAIFPLKCGTHVRMGMTFRFLEIPRHAHLPLSDFIGTGREEDRGVLRALLKHLAERPQELAWQPPWDYLCFQHLLEDSCAASWLESDRPPLLLLEKHGRCNYIRVGVSYDQIESGFTRNFRGNLRKARNKLLETGAVEFVSARDRSTLGAFFDEFLELEASGWKGIEGSGIKLHRDLTRFYRNLIDTFSPRGACEINLLRLREKCIAGQFCLVVGDTCYVLKIGYDEANSRLAPGNMLMEWLLKRYAAGEGRVSSVNLVTNAEWHHNWKPCSNQVLSADLFRRSPRGLLLFAGCQTLRTRERGN